MPCVQSFVQLPKAGSASIFSTRKKPPKIPKATRNNHATDTNRPDRRRVWYSGRTQVRPDERGSHTLCCGRRTTLRVSEQHTATKNGTRTTHPGTQRPIAPTP